MPPETTGGTAIASPTVRISINIGGLRVAHRRAGWDAAQTAYVERLKTLDPAGADIVRPTGDSHPTF